MIKYIVTFKNYISLLIILVKRDISKKYKNSYLGILWSLINPLLQMVVLTIVFSAIFKNSIKNFSLYMISGRLIFDFFTQGTTHAMSSIYNSSNLIKKVYFPKYIMTVSRVLSDFIIFLISMIDLGLVILITGSKLTFNVIYAPLYLILLFIFVVGFGLILATVATFFRDMEHLYGIFTLTLMYFSAIFYPVSIIPEKFKFLLYFNPIYHYISGFREIIYYGNSPDLSNIVICFGISFFTFVLGVFIFKKYQDSFILHI